MIHFQCHTCGAHLRAKDSQAGQSFACANCRTTVEVPDADFFREGDGDDGDSRDADLPVAASAEAADKSDDWWSDVPASPPPEPLPREAPETSEAEALALPPPEAKEEKEEAKQPPTGLGKIFPDLADPIKSKAILPGAAMVMVSIMSMMLALAAVPVLMFSLYMGIYHPENYDACSTSLAMLWTIGCGIYYAMALVRAMHFLLLIDREQAMIGAMMMLVPCNPCWLLGLPAGLWALSVLRNEEVRKAFEK